MDCIFEIINCVISIEKEHSFVIKVKEKTVDHKVIALSLIELTKAEISKNDYKKIVSTHSLASKTS